MATGENQRQLQRQKSHRRRQQGQVNSNDRQESTCCAERFASKTRPSFSQRLWGAYSSNALNDNFPCPLARNFDPIAFESIKLLLAPAEVVQSTQATP